MGDARHNGHERVVRALEQSANFAAMLEACEELLVLAKPGCPVLRQFWGKICKGRGWFDAAETGLEAREAFCASLPSERVFQTKGGKVSPSKWLGLPGTFRRPQASWHTKAYGLTLYCILKGFSSTAGDIINTSCMHKFAEVQPHKPCLELAAVPMPVDAPLPAASSTDIVPPAAAAPAALEKQKQAGRDQAQRLRQKAENTMHAVARIMADESIYEVLSMLSCFCALEVEAHTEGVRTMKSGNAMRRYYASCSQGGYMRALVATLKQLENMTELSKSGFVTEFSDAVRARGKHDAAYVKDQDALASTAFKLCVSLVGERLFSMQSHELVYPYALGGLAADEDAVVLQTTERFRSHWEVWAEAMRVKIPSVARAAERCSLNTPAMRQLARILRKGDYKDVSVAKREGVKLFSGFGQTVINENANSKVRDAELRQQSARRLVEWKAWEVPHAKRVLNQFERAEVAPTNVLCGLARVDGTSLFHGSGDPKLEFPSLNFAKLLTGFDGPSPDALGRRKLGAELALLLELKRLGKWELMADAWQAALAPSHEFVLGRQTSPPRVYFVLKSFDVGLLTWSCKRVGVNGIRLDTDGARWSWVQVFDAGALSILPTTVMSPLGTFTRGDVPLSALGIFVSHGAPIPLFTWQASRGFANVPEASLKMLFGAQAIPLPIEAARSENEELALAVGLSEHFLEDATPEVLENAVRARYALLDQVDVGATAVLQQLVIDEIIEGVGSLSEKKFCTEYLGKTKQHRHKRSAHMAAVSVILRIFEDHRDKKPPAKKPKPKGSNKVELPKGHAAKYADGRWWASIPGDKAFLIEHGPPVGSVFQDDANGRYRIQYPGQVPRSISWTSRGQTAAALEALRVWWTWHTDATGAMPPEGLGIACA